MVVPTAFDDMFGSTCGFSRRRFVAVAAAWIAAGCSGRADQPRARAATPAQSAAPSQAELVVRGGTIITMDDNQPQTDALAIAGGRIVALGSDARALVGPRTEVLDLRGGTAVPGLTDAHGHLVGLGRSLESVDLRGSRSIDEVVARLQAKAPPSGRITGRGWDQNLWPDKAMPTHHALSKAFPERPAWIVRVDGHAGWANAAMLRAAKIDRFTANPEGGEILRDKNGNPTGVLVDAAMNLIGAEEATAADLRRAILSAQDHLLERGLTGVHEMGIGPEADAVYRELAANQGLRVRVHAYAHRQWFAGELIQRAPDQVTPETVYALVGVKLFADGALGSRGAALLDSYADRSDHRGFMLTPRPELERLVQGALRRGWQVATHAIGDAANRTILDVYEAALASSPATDPRLRVEHCQVVTHEDIVRFARLGILASMQPTHATSDMAWVPERLGPARVDRAYAWRRFVDSGAHLVFGSDFPVELADVTHGLHAAVTRQDRDGQPAGGWLPDQRVELEQALRSFGHEAAYAVHREQHLGRLAVGFQADITCFRQPIHDLAPDRLHVVEIAGTLVEGNVRYWV
jgi:hypothetical protein